VYAERQTMPNGRGISRFSKGFEVAGSA
ncbi:MAG: hypothetical protein JWR80_9124, partial [Bradyrhizobium sp.]|nr:hypothetical protein [Bradyrhizobium sp.]